jgi:hypothetical protein
MWYKLSQQWTNRNVSSRPTPYDGGPVSNDPNRKIWQDQNYVYFVDDSGATKSMQKIDSQGNQNTKIQQVLNKNLNQIPKNNPSNNSGNLISKHHDYNPQKTLTKQQQVQSQQEAYQNMRNLVPNMFGVQQNGNSAAINNPFGQTLKKLFPDGKLPSVTDTGRQTVKMQ